MDHATCIITDKWTLVNITDIQSGKINFRDILEARCSECGASASFVNASQRVIHFKSCHEPWCINVKTNRKHKAYKVNVSTIIDDPDSIIDYHDHAPASPRGIDPKGKKKPKEKNEIDSQIDDIDSVKKYSIRHIHTVGGIYSFIRENGIDADIGGGRTGRNMLLDARALRDVRLKGIQGTKIAIVRRVNPKKLKHHIDIPSGYTCFHDAFTSKVEESVFFLVKLNHKKQNRLFRNRVKGCHGMKKRKSHKNLLLLGCWERLDHNNYIVLSAEINSHCYYFLNYRGF